MVAEHPDTIAPVTRPPRELLLLAAGSVIVGAALLLVTGLAVNVAGYALSSFVTIGLLAAYQRVDVARRNRPRYVADPRLRRLGPIVAVAGVAVAVIHVWRIATELAG
jgi:uncharacterized membrane protein YphA (DoxX/SURF4 family)